MDGMLPISAETGDVPSKHLLVRSYVHVLEDTAPGTQAETPLYLRGQLQGHVPQRSVKPRHGAVSREQLLALSSATRNSK